MATITSRTIKGTPQFSNKFTSAAADPVADTVEIEVDPSLTHVFVGVQMFDGGGALVLGSAGTFAVSVLTDNTGQWETPAASTIDATAPETVGVAGNIQKVRVVPTGVTGVVTFQVKVTCNRN